MSGFVALNVEPEDTIEEEDVDDSKEIQLEEAFKLYQNALRLQSLGSGSLQEAHEAYDDLFASEVFKDPEAISNYAHDQLADDDDHLTSQSAPQELSAPPLAADASANSIPQLLYLAYKNRGELRIRQALSNILASPDDTGIRSSLQQTGRAVLADFSEALARDDTDIDIWKKAARVTDLLSSQRIARFCLESVLAGDEDENGASVDISGLDEAFSLQKLNQLVASLEDDLAQQQLPPSTIRTKLAKNLISRNEPYSGLPPGSGPFDYRDDRHRPINFKPVRHVMKPARSTWPSFARAILQALVEEANGTMYFGPGGAIHVEIAEDLEAVAQVVRSDTGTAANALPPAPEATEDIVESPVKELEVSNPSNEDQTEALERSETQTAVDPSVSVALPTRKRSSTAAGNDEPEARSRSKRLRARESMIDSAVVEDDVGPGNPTAYTELIDTCRQADQWTFRTVNSLLSRFGVTQLEGIDSEGVVKVNGHTTNVTLDDLGQANTSAMDLLLTDFKDLVQNWSDDQSHAYLSDRRNQDSISGQAGLTLFLQHSRTDARTGSEIPAPETDERLRSFVNQINEQWSTIHDIAHAFLENMLCGSRGDQPSYMSYKWSDDMKEAIVNILIRDDQLIYTVTQERLSRLSDPFGQELQSALPPGLLHLIQGVFELHLDIFYSITNPSSAVDSEQRTCQQDRLARWADLASRAYAMPLLEGSEAEALQVRYIFATAMYAIKLEEDNSEHVQACLKDLLNLLKTHNEFVLLLPNNVAMPEISQQSIKREMSRLSTLDFFHQIFDSDNENMVEVIESLEPILYASFEFSPSMENEAAIDDFAETSKQEKLVTFINSGDASLKLYLWKRLQSAYQSVPYYPMVVSTQLRAIETLVQDVLSDRHTGSSSTKRQETILRALRDADDLSSKIISRALQERSGAFDCIDEAHLKTSMTAISGLLRLVHVFVIFDDNLKSGVAGSITRSAASSRNFEKSKDRLRDCLIRLWTLLYLLLQEATKQRPDLYPNSADDLAEFLRAVHHGLGIRHYCKFSNRMFLKLAKTELINTSTDEDYGFEIEQILYDLYQLKFVTTGYANWDHGCSPENYDRRSACELVPFVTTQANRVNMRDLLKGEIRSSIERTQQAVGNMKTTPNILYNRRAISAFLKSPINSKDLVLCTKGVGDLPTKPVHDDTKAYADCGWYFLLGHLALAKFRSVKRVSPTPTEDLDNAAQYLRQDLEHGIEKWETWYRLAQVFEAKIEEDLLWNSTKLNDNRGEIATLERSSIHAFTMAIAMVMRSSDVTEDTAEKITDLFTEFAVRLYASTREPLSMEAFKTDKSVRYFSREADQSMYKSPSIKPMQPHTVWSFATYLLRKKFGSKEKSWLSYFTLGKCLWKMLQFEMANPDHLTKAARRTTKDDVLSAFTMAIEVLPVKSEKSSDYILEPHFKIVSIVYKMVRQKLMTPATGVEALKATPHSRFLHLSSDETGQPEWDTYILAFLKRLGNADRSKWHHRIIARAAHVIYDDQQDVSTALGAKHEFTQQIFTKTMTMQVWKPEHERPGRHYVYMGRYLLFFVELLSRLGDRANLDQLLRRIRRKPADFLDHSALWEKCVTTYVKMLRRVGKVVEGQEKTVFHESVSHDEFERLSGMLEKSSQEPNQTSILLDILRDAVELKKLNLTLMKGGLVDDLIMDTYAVMYENFVAQLPPEQKQAPMSSPPKPSTPVATFVTMASLEQGSPLGDGRMRVGNLLVGGDGASDNFPTPPRPIGLGLQTSSLVPTHSLHASPTPPVQQISKPGGRAKNITKAELKRKVDALVVRPPPIKTPVLTKKSPGDLIDQTPSRNRRGTSANPEGDEDGDVDMDEDRSQRDNDEDGQQDPEIAESPQPNDNEDDDEGNADDIDGDLDEANEGDDEADEDDEDNQSRLTDMDKLGPGERVHQNQNGNEQEDNDTQDPEEFQDAREMRSPS